MYTIGQNALLISLAACVAGFFPASLFAETTVIQNVVSANSSSGGNVVTAGEVVTGKSENSISVETVINGEIVEAYSSTSEEPVSYERTTSVGAGSVTTKVKASTSVSVETQEKETSAQAQTEGETLDKTSTTSAAVSFAAAATTNSVSFISNLLAKIFAYVTFWISLR